jgi:alpha-L-fucosidase 2
MAFHPMGLIDYSQGDSSRILIDNTLKRLKEIGPDWWCGYSYSWLGNLYAKAMKGEEAAEALRTFATCFCLPNSFHVNGDQSKSGKSKFTYRPFTLEGNFAFASGLQEMLIQSHTGVVRLFPAIPETWQNVSFNKMRTEGAFLVTARQMQGELKSVVISSEKGGRIKLFNSFSGPVKCDYTYKTEGDLLIFDLKPGQTINVTRGDYCLHSPL